MNLHGAVILICMKNNQPKEGLVWTRNTLSTRRTMHVFHHSDIKQVGDGIEGNEEFSSQPQKKWGSACGVI